MKIAVRFLLFFFFALIFRQLSAQTVSIGAMRPYLDTLSLEQKIDLLAYMRHLGSSIDREVTQSYLQLDKAQQERALQYTRLELLKRSGREASDDRTTVRWAQDTIQLGKVWENEAIIDSFLVTNTGAKPYIIKDVKATCDCTVLRRPTYPLMPGETAAIRVEFDPRGKIGQTTPGVVVYDNTRPNGRHIVYLNADVVPRVKPKNSMGN
ncbi:MAG: DUF1573 domain-containing protein [Saprospiraceae bacterium]|nr:DUF1573 domain-containing protein [Saprospiraceae bacterium]